MLENENFDFLPARLPQAKRPNPEEVIFFGDNYLYNSVIVNSYNADTLVTFRKAVISNNSEYWLRAMNKVEKKITLGNW